MPRATTAAWLVLPPRLVRMPLGGDHAVQVVRVGLAADQDDRLAGGGPLDRAVAESKTTLADRGTRRGADARW